MRQVRVRYPANPMSDPFTWFDENVLQPTGISHIGNEVIRFLPDTITTANNAGNQLFNWTGETIGKGFDAAGDLIVGTVGLAVGVAGALQGGQQIPSQSPPPQSSQNLPLMPILLIGGIGAILLLNRPKR